MSYSVVDGSSTSKWYVGITLCSKLLELQETWPMWQIPEPLQSLSSVLWQVKESLSYRGSIMVLQLLLLYKFNTHWGRIWIQKPLLKTYILYYWEIKKQSGHVCASGWELRGCIYSIENYLDLGCCLAPPGGGRFDLFLYRYGSLWLLCNLLGQWL